MFNHGLTLFLWSILTASLMGVAVAGAPDSPDRGQAEIDRIAPFVRSPFFDNGHVVFISAPPKASDESLIEAAVKQLNYRPIKDCKILKKELVQSDHISKGIPDFCYLAAAVSTDQGDKLVIINMIFSRGGKHWARLYNCDATFSSPQDGGTPLIR